jgi:hypothetical protein
MFRLIPKSVVSKSRRVLVRVPEWTARSNLVEVPLYHRLVISLRSAAHVAQGSTIGGRGVGGPRAVCFYGLL